MREIVIISYTEELQNFAVLDENCEAIVLIYITVLYIVYNPFFLLSDPDLESLNLSTLQITIESATTNHTAPYITQHKS